MITETTLSNLARSSFFIGSDVVYRPSEQRTVFQFDNRPNSFFLAPFASLDEIEAFDLTDRRKGDVAQTKAQFLEDVLSHENILQHSTGDSGIAREQATSQQNYQKWLRGIIEHIVFCVFPRMYELGADVDGMKVDKTALRNAISRVFGRLEAKFGQAPVDNSPRDKLIRHHRESIPELDLVSWQQQVYKSDDLAVKQFPASIGNSVSSRIFNGMPYFVHEGKIYKLERGGLIFSNSPLQTDRGKFSLKPIAHFDSIHTLYLKALNAKLHTGVLERLETEADVLQGTHNPRWYIGRLMEQGYFEWDFVGFFVNPHITSPAVCYVYRRINKFAMVDPYDTNGDREQRICYPFGETRVGLRLINNGSAISLQDRPVTIDRINHPAENYDYYPFRGICNDATFPGDEAAKIAEGVACLRHSITGSRGARAFDRNGRLTVREAREKGYEIYCMR